MLSDPIVIETDGSSLIKKIEYDPDLLLLTVHFKSYYTDKLSYTDVYPDHFDEMVKAPSVGKFYLQYIKPNFKQTKESFMADEKKRPPTKNQASDKKRFIKIPIDVQKIKKEWLFAGEKGTYLNVTLQMLPDGELDKHGNLGMVTQDVPQKIYEAEKNLPKAEKTLGPILGNGAEMDWAPGGATPGVEQGEMGAAVEDDLPF
jgi:hypothetical protein